MKPAPFVLGVDLDGVVGDYEEAFRHVVAAELGIDPSEIPQQDHFSFSESQWPIDSGSQFDELHRIAVAKYRMLANMDVFPGASDVLWRLSDAGVYIRVITHRLCVNWDHDIAVADTVSWLQHPREDGRPRIPYRDLCFVADKTDVGADLYIDDAPHNVLALRRARAETACFDAAYNRHIPGLRVHSWDDIETLVNSRLLERVLLDELEA